MANNNTGFGSGGGGGGGGGNAEAEMRKQQERFILERRTGKPPRQAWHASPPRRDVLPGTNQYTREEIFMFVSRTEFPAWAQGFGDMNHSDDVATRTYVALAVVLNGLMSQLIGTNSQGVAGGGMYVFDAGNMYLPKVVLHITWVLSERRARSGVTLGTEEQVTTDNVVGVLFRASALDPQYEFWRAFRVHLCANSMSDSIQREIARRDGVAYREYIRAQRKQDKDLREETIAVEMVNGLRDYAVGDEPAAPWVGQPIGPGSPPITLPVGLRPRACENYSLMATRNAVYNGVANSTSASSAQTLLPGTIPGAHEVGAKKIDTWAAFASTVYTKFGLGVDSVNALNGHNTYATAFERWDPLNPKNALSLSVAIAKMEQVVASGGRIDPVFLNPQSYYGANNTIQHPFELSTQSIDLIDTRVAKDLFAALCNMRFPFRAMKFEAELKIQREAVREAELQMMHKHVCANNASLMDKLAAMRGFHSASDAVCAWAAKSLDGRSPLGALTAEMLDGADKHEFIAQLCERYVPSLGRALQMRIDAEGNEFIQSNFGYLYDQMQKRYLQALVVREYSQEGYARLIRALRHDASSEFFHVFTSNHFNNGDVMRSIARYLQRLTKRSVYEHIPLIDTKLTAFGNRVASDLISFSCSLGVVTGHHYFHMMMYGVRTIAVHNGLAKIHVLCVGPAAAGKSHIMFLMIACSVDGTLQSQQGKSSQANNDETAQDDAIYLTDEASGLVSRDPAHLDARQLEQYNRERVARSEGRMSGVRSVQGIYSRRFEVSHRVTFVASSNVVEAASENSMQTRHRIEEMSIEKANGDGVLSLIQFLPKTQDTQNGRSTACLRLRTDQALMSTIAKMQYCHALAPTCIMIGNLLGPVVVHAIRDYVPSAAEHVRPNERFMSHLYVNPIFRAIHSLYHTQSSPYQNVNFDLSQLHSAEPMLCANYEDFQWALGFTLKEYISNSTFLTLMALAMQYAKFKPSAMQALYTARPRHTVASPDSSCYAPSAAEARWSVPGWRATDYGRERDTDMPAFWAHELHIIEALTRNIAATAVPTYKRCAKRVENAAGGDAPPVDAITYDPNYIQIKGRYTELLARGCNMLETYAGASYNSVKYHADRLLQTQHNSMMMPVLATIDNETDALRWSTVVTGRGGNRAVAIQHARMPVLEYNDEANVLYISTYWLSACTPRMVWMTALTCTEDRFTAENRTLVLPFALPGAPYLTDTLSLRRNLANNFEINNPMYSGGSKHRIGRDFAVSSACSTVTLDDIINVLRQYNVAINDSDAKIVAQMVRDQRNITHSGARDKERVAFNAKQMPACVLYNSHNTSQIKFTESVEQTCYKYFAIEEGLIGYVNSTPVEEWPEYPGNYDKLVREMHNKVFNDNGKKPPLLPTQSYPTAIMPTTTKLLLSLKSSSARHSDVVDMSIDNDDVLTNMQDEDDQLLRIYDNSDQPAPVGTRTLNELLNMNKDAVDAARDALQDEEQRREANDNPDFGLESTLAIAAAAAAAPKRGTRVMPGSRRQTPQTAATTATGNFVPQLPLLPPLSSSSPASTTTSSLASLDAYSHSSSSITSSSSSSRRFTAPGAAAPRSVKKPTQLARLAAARRQAAAAADNDDDDDGDTAAAAATKSSSKKRSSNTSRDRNIVRRRLITAAPAHLASDLIDDVTIEDD